MELALQGAGAGGADGVDAIGGELLRGNGMRHGIITLRFEDGTGRGLSLKLGEVKRLESKGLFWGADCH